MIQYKCDWNHRTFHKISRWFPSSKTCSCCGHKQEGQKDLYDQIIPEQQGNWDRVISIPLVLQKLTTEIERSVIDITVGQVSEQTLNHKGLRS